MFRVDMTRLNYDSGFGFFRIYRVLRLQEKCHTNTGVANEHRHQQQHGNWDYLVSKRAQTLCI